jgi:hypothetical protein
MRSIDEFVGCAGVIGAECRLDGEGGMGMSLLATSQNLSKSSVIDSRCVNVESSRDAIEL